MVKFLSFSRQILSAGITIRPARLRLSKLWGVLFGGMRTLLGKVPPLLCALIATGAGAQVSASRAVSPNHLNGSKSSYLQRASQQPIDWYPWGEEAFRKAKDLNRPILLDLGAEWCRYCAQMDRESYERPEMAKFVNDHLVSIKVDYSMQPEVGARLQGAQAYMNLLAGLPLTTFLSPSGKLYFDGGYFPEEPRGGKSSLGEMLERALCMFREQRETIESGGVGDRTWERVQLHEKHKEVAGVGLAHRRDDLFA
jgi:uncharacterized protein YyaL (SSP411 family)